MGEGTRSDKQGGYLPASDTRQIVNVTFLSCYRVSETAQQVEGLVWNTKFDASSCKMAEKN